MPTNTRPPNNSAGIRILWTYRLPKKSPNREIRNVTRAMMAEGVNGSESRKANDKPTASASMLVATANVSTTTSRVGFFLEASQQSSSSLKCSTIIFTPNARRMPNAIQWSKCSMYWLKELPAYQPIKGMRPWNRPNRKAIRRYDQRLVVGVAVAGCLEVEVVMEAEAGCLEAMPAKKIPQAMETAKQSMARPSAIRMMSIRFMQFDVQKDVPQRYTFLVSLQPNQGT